MILPESLDELLRNNGKYGQKTWSNENVEKIKRLYKISNELFIENNKDYDTHGISDYRYEIEIKPDSKSSIKSKLSRIVISRYSRVFEEYLTVYALKRHYLLHKDILNDTDKVLEIRFSRYGKLTDAHIELYRVLIGVAVRDNIKLTDAYIELYRPGNWEELLEEDYAKKLAVKGSANPMKTK